MYKNILTRLTNFFYTAKLTCLLICIMYTAEHYNKVTLHFYTLVSMFEILHKLAWQTESRSWDKNKLMLVN